jgi:hypothetical protein
LLHTPIQLCAARTSDAPYRDDRAGHGPGAVSWIHSGDSLQIFAGIRQEDAQGVHTRIECDGRAILFVLLVFVIWLFVYYCLFVIVAIIFMFLTR